MKQHLTWSNRGQKDLIADFIIVNNSYNFLMHRNGYRVLLSALVGLCMPAVSHDSYNKGGCGSGGRAVVNQLEGWWFDPWPLQSTFWSVLVLGQGTEPQMAPSGTSLGLCMNGYWPCRAADVLHGNPIHYLMGAETMFGKKDMTVLMTERPLSSPARCISRRVERDLGVTGGRTAERDPREEPYVICCSRSLNQWDRGSCRRC